MLRHFVFLDRLLDRALLIRSVMDDADELGRRPPDVIDRPGGVTLFGRALGLARITIAPTGLPGSGPGAPLNFWAMPLLSSRYGCPTI
jgi:hypothetical protein